MASGDGKLKSTWRAHALGMRREAGVTSGGDGGRRAKLTFEEEGKHEAHKKKASRQRAAGRWQFRREGLVVKSRKSSSRDIRESTGSTAGSRKLAHGHERITFTWQVRSWE